MLRITRRAGQAVKAYDREGRELTIIIVGVDGNQVRMGFVEPDGTQDFEIVREELLEDRPPRVIGRPDEGYKGF